MVVMFCDGNLAFKCAFVVCEISFRQQSVSGLAQARRSKSRSEFGLTDHDCLIWN